MLHTRRAWTLIEVLVTLAVVALLLALTLPAIANARESARLAARLSTHRTVAQAITAYAGNWNDTPPTLPRFEGTSVGDGLFVNTMSVPRAIWRLGPSPRDGFSVLAYQIQNWKLGAILVATGTVPDRSIVGTTLNEDWKTLSMFEQPHSFRLQSAFFFAPEAFAMTPRRGFIDRPHLFAAQRLSAARFPADKVLAYEEWSPIGREPFRAAALARDGRPFPLAFVDGSAEQSVIAEAGSTVHNHALGLGSTDPRPLATPEGVRGHDR